MVMIGMDLIAKKNVAHVRFVRVRSVRSDKYKEDCVDMFDALCVCC